MSTTGFAGYSEVNIDLCTGLLPGTAGLSSSAGHAVGQAPGVKLTCSEKA